MSTVARSINVIICYSITDPETGETQTYQEPYKVTQPGFTEPRAIPEFKLSLHNDFESLDKINKLDNGVMCNQFRTYLDIEIDKFDDTTWGVSDMEDITLDFDISHIPYNSQVNNKSNEKRPLIKLCTNTTLQNLVAANKTNDLYTEEFRRSGTIERTLQAEFNRTTMASDNIMGQSRVRDSAPRRPLSIQRTNQVENIDNNRPAIQDSSALSIVSSLKTDYKTDCCVKKDYIEVYKNIEPKLTCTQTSCQNYYSVTCNAIESPVKPEVTTSLYNNQTNAGIQHAIISLDKDYIVMNGYTADMYANKSSAYSDITTGIRHDMNISFKGILLNDIIENNKIRIAIDLEFGNPCIAQVFYQFAVTGMTIHYKGQDFSLTSTPTQTSYLSQSTYSEYTTYKYISNPLKAYINPISLTAASAVHESTITDLTAISGSVKKTGDESNISLVAELYNGRMYAELYNSDNTANPIWSGLWPLSSAFNDTVQDLKISTVLPADIISKVKIPEFYTEETTEISPIINKTALEYKPVLGDLAGNKYFTVFYNAKVMHPRYRNEKETFYYNDNEYNAEKYSQFGTEDSEGSYLSPIYLNCEPAIGLRTDEEMQAIDTWNFEYQVYREQNDKDDKTIPGEKTLYGNGWLFLPNDEYENIDQGQYNDDKILGLAELKRRLSDRGIFHNYNTFSSVNLTKTQKYPDNDKLFRALVYDMKWEFPYETFADDSKGMSPYIGHSLLVSPFDMLLIYCLRSNELKTKYNDVIGTNNNVYIEHYEHL